jgi:hypothetical protein
MANITPDSQLEFELGEGETETSVEVSEQETEDSGSGSTIEASAPAPAAKPEPEKSELDQVSENVQKRIAKLTAKMREAERREQAAIDYARNVQAKAQQLEQQLVTTDQSRVHEAKSRVETQQMQLKAIIRRAREEGDIDTETEAQERLMQLSMEQRQLQHWEESRPEPQPARVQQQAPVQQQQYQQPARQQPAPSPRAEEWAEKNEWFGKDRTMTYAAWGIHQTLIEEEGIDPDSDEYYTELDNRLRNDFPNKFRAAPTNNRQRSNVPAVAPASRSSGVNSARRTVKLSPSQVAIAKKLGVPLEEYAKYVKE